MMLILYDQKCDLMKCFQVRIGNKKSTNVSYDSALNCFAPLIGEMLQPIPSKQSLYFGKIFQII